MKICHVYGYYDPVFREEGAGADQLLKRYPPIRELPAELVKRGHFLTVLHHFHQNFAAEAAGVSYEFIKPRLFFEQSGKMASLFFRRMPYPYFQPATGILKRLVNINPDIIHFFGLTILPNLWLVSRWAWKNKIPVIVHYHGGSPARHWLARRLERKILARVSRVLFTTEEQSVAWINAGLSAEKIGEVMETSVTFQCRSRDKARRETGLAGNPVFVSAGRLHPVKDPLTMLRGFAGIAEEWPESRLYLFYRSAGLLPEVRDEICKDGRLRNRVELRGEVPYPEMESILNSADFYVQCSRREFSGYAVLEAMACGAIPVITDIPSFRQITDNGEYALLFPPENPTKMKDAVLRFDRKNIPRFSRRIKEKFERDLSFPALAAKIEEVYLQLVARQKPNRAEKSAI